jgi:hypothetical protein
MVTPHGVQMSERATRIYSYLQARGISLTTFSTDFHVKHYMPQLKIALAALQDGTHRQIAWSEQWVNDAIRDLEAIMRRTPENRSR